MTVGTTTTTTMLVNRNTGMLLPLFAFGVGFAIAQEAKT